MTLPVETHLSRICGNYSSEKQIEQPHVILQNDVGLIPRHFAILRGMIPHKKSPFSRAPRSVEVQQHFFVLYFFHFQRFAVIQ